MYEVLQLSKIKTLEALPDLDGKSCRVLLFLACLANESDYVEVIPSKLCKQLKTTKAVFSSALTTLRKKGLIKIVNTSSNGLGHMYRLCLDDEDIRGLAQETLF